MKWKNLYFLVLTSPYCERHKKQTPAHACSHVQARQKVSNVRGAQGCDGEKVVQMQGRNVYSLFSVNIGAFGIQNFHLSQYEKIHPGPQADFFFFPFRIIHVNNQKRRKNCT